MLKGLKSCDVSYHKIKSLQLPSSSPLAESGTFLTPELARRIRDEFGTPTFVYDEAALREQAAAAQAFPHPFGLTVRYALKANPNAMILRLFDTWGLHFDASSGHEAHRAIKVGIAPDKVSLSAQQLPADLLELAELGIRFVATSLHQLETWGQSLPGTSLAVRFNPGVGSGSNNRTNVGGPHASFGIWHELLADVQQLAARYELMIDRIHTHIGSGSDPDVWSSVAQLSLDLVERIETVTQLDLGGGYKVGRMPNESTTDLQLIGRPVQDALVAFAHRTGRQLHLEIEPGTYLLASAGLLLTTIQDIVSTGAGGHKFLRTDTGLTEILRPAMYGAQHPMTVIPTTATSETGRYVVVGHCCETSDILTPAAGDPETVAERELTRASIGDLLVIGGAGAYCSSMSAANYNSFPVAPEVLLSVDGQPRLIRRRQTLDEAMSLEM